jgi:hypothetical protein
LPKLALRADPQEQQIGAGLQECYEGRGRKSKEGKALRHQILFLQDKADIIGAWQGLALRRFKREFACFVFGSEECWQEKTLGKVHFERNALRQFEQSQSRGKSHQRLSHWRFPGVKLSHSFESCLKDILSCFVYFPQLLVSYLF